MAHRPQQILIDARLVAYRRGGIARYVARLIEWLPRVAPDLTFQRIVNRTTEHSQIEDTRVRTPPHFRFERETLGVEIMARRPALIHSPDFIAPIALGSRQIVTVHDLAFVRRPELLTREAQRYYGQIERSVAVADRVIAVSAYTAGQLGEFTRIRSEKIVVIPNGVDHSEYQLSREQAATYLQRMLVGGQQLVATTDRPVILVVGTIEPRKRQQLVLQALVHDPLTRMDVSPLVVLVGQRGWACETIVAQIHRATAAGQAIWLEHVSDQLLAALYRHAALLAMPSVDEGFGLPMLEAMAAGLPVVAAKRGALPEIAGDAAVLVDDDRPEVWSMEIATLLSDQSRRHELQRAGPERAAQFSWKQTAATTAALYREVLGH